MNKEFRDMIHRNNWVVLDTETTGLERPAEICQIGIVDSPGKTLLDTLVKPKGSIPSAATDIHGIDNELVQDAPIWPDVRERVLDIISGRDVIVYNAVYDRKLMHWSDEAWDAPERIEYKAASIWWCAMEAYAAYYGELNQYYRTYRWQRLSNAMLQQGLPISDAHSAIGDAQMTRRLIMAVCGKLDSAGLGADHV